MHPPADLAEFRETRLSVRGMDVAVFESDVVEGPAFVLIHGFAVSSRYFGPLARELSQHGRVLVLDLPGFGKTNNPGHAPRITEFAHVINVVIRELTVVSPLLIGHSMGAQVAVEALVQAPGLACGAVLAGPVANDRERRGWLVLWRFAQSAVKETVGAMWASVRGFFRSGPRWLTHAFGPMVEYRIEDRVAETMVPLTVVGGTGDRVAPPDWCHRLAGVRDGIDVVIVEGAAHEMIHTHASEVTQVALDLTQRGLDAALSTEGRTAPPTDGRTAPPIGWSSSAQRGTRRARVETAPPIGGRVVLGEERGERVSRPRAEERGLDTSRLVPRGDYSTTEKHDEHPTTGKHDEHSTTGKHGGARRRLRPTPGLPPCGD